MTDDIGTVRWFGEDWGAPVCDPRAHIETPVDAVCQGHDHRHDRSRSAYIEEGDQGVTVPFVGGDRRRAPTRLVWHLDCWLHEVGADVRTPPQVTS